MAPTTPKASSSASSPIKTRSPSTKVSGQRKSKSPKKPTTYSPKKKSSLSVKLPNTSTSKQAQNDGGDDHDAADEDSLFFSLEDAPSNPPESVLDGMVPKPPSEEKKTRKRDNDSHSGDSASELSAMMKGIVEDVKKLELEDVQNSDSSDSESASKGLSREARATRNSMTMMKSKAKSTDHKVCMFLLSGEDFTINDIISRIEDDDPDLTSLTIRQTGQNIKDVVVPAHDDDHNDDDSVQISESIILVLPAHLTNNKMVELSTSLSQNRCLLMLDLRGNSITDESCVSICNALKQNHKIQNLNLSQNRITSKGAASVVPLINKCLVTLNLSKNVLGDAGIQSLAGGIASTKTLKEIHLSDCKIRSSGASFLASAFAVNKSLQTINLQGNVCGNGSSSKRLAFALMRSQRLRHLYMGDTGIGEGIEHFARLVETTKSLKTFDLSHNFLADKAATTLGNALMINRSITHLILKRNKITSDGLQLLSACLVSNIFITSLDVGGNLIGDSGFMKLCTVLETNTSLFELDISDNRIGVEGANAISSVLKINKTLVTLNMTDNPIQYGGVMNLCQALELNETLCVCYVSVDELGKEGVDELSYEGEGSGNSPFWETRLVVV
ncbi:hypothetical protein TL16_g10183 [Triparma laevis f. inornata]|uniref:RNI-like protein n=1 Tax=Triparma laevis f. inornata TaxID=1714386 RepID=A0A9W7BAZ6_9STRA|nr:hypothetical protein TL16_g10183 [Triparma laevis f. inornata]